ncbi:MAG: molybdenum ABC transporter permease subunit [Betaproteobacteria bacterium RIFCSPLOWO2_12_FULL_65_14]|nr:MAG: molybdenum ABC transporter permease subunit [Betaproteobacteria bacterium RIFCSPLOWO2_12_FULL_65_14]
MDWPALALSLKLAAWTAALLLPIGVVCARWLAWRRFPGKPWVEGFLALPLVLPPTVLGYYFLVAFSAGATLGQMYESVIGRPLAFTFEGLVLASIVFNLPFAIQPMQRAFEAIAPEVRDAASCCGMTRWRAFVRVELPLAWPGVLSAMVLTFAHTLGEFGVVLMVGGNIPGETKTVSIAIYDRVQAFELSAAGTMSAVLLVLALAAMAVVYSTSSRTTRKHG